MTKKLKQSFTNLDVKSVVVHWDTKIMENISGKFVDRLAVIAIGVNFQQLLGIPEVSAGTELEISSVVFYFLESWALLNKTQAFVFYTIASNTGRYNGACTLLENKLDRDIIFFDCRHHIFEIILADILKKCKISLMTGPDIPLFKRFKAKWNNIYLNKFVTGISNIDIKNALGNNYIEILNYAKLKLSSNLTRDDYE